MTIEELKNHFKELGRVKRLKKTLQTLKIDWETDLNRMIFSDLRSQGFLNFDIKDECQRIRLDTIDISNEYVYFKKENLDIYFQDEGTHDLINFIGKKNIIIPPLYEMPLEYFGETFETRQLSPIRRLDGSHRVFVSFFSGLRKIPIVVTERVTKFSFPIDKWDLERTDESFTAKSKNGEHRIELNNRRTQIDNYMFCGNTLLISISYNQKTTL